MSKFFLAFGLTAYLLSASVDGSTCDEGGCTQTCSSDDDNGNCPAQCPDCGGCLQLKLLVVSDGSASLQADSFLAPERKVEPPQSPAPGDILHVPIARLA